MIAGSLFDLDKIDGSGQFFVLLPLPIGISFYTFQGISLLIDVYRNKTSNKQFNIDPSFLVHFNKTIFFTSFFPQLVAGPIVKAHNFFPQIKNKLFKNIDWDFAFKQLILGYFFKIVIADNLKDQTFWIAYPYFQAESSLTLIVMLFGYSIQIFADFAGYSLIAIGIASLFGYRLPDNFNFPYISTSFSEFWTRWHISLSTWLKEYLYIPLGGNKKGANRTYFNLLTVMFLGGLWHGASWNYAIWGSFHGIALAVERLIVTRQTKKRASGTKQTLKMLFVFSFVSFAWLFFKLPEFSHTLLYLKALTQNMSKLNNHLAIICILFYSLPVVLYHFYYLFGTSQLFKRKILPLNYIAYGLMFFLLVVSGGSSGAFIYFQF